MTVEQALEEAVTAYERGLDDVVGTAVRQAAARVPAFARRLDAADIDVAAVTSAAAVSELPVVTKDEVLQAQAENPPFGGLLASDADVARVFQSPGPLYEPQLTGDDPWRWGEALVDLGVGPGDTVINCFGYHLSPAGAMFDAGARSVGAAVLPGGIGNQDLQVRAVCDLGVTAYTGLPSYLKALVERFDELGLPAERWRLTKALVTAEPLPNSLRDLLRRRVPHVQMAYGTAETGLLAHEVADGEGLVPSRDVLVQVCDLGSGAPITEGVGQIVVTLLRTEYPLVRFGTGDLSAWMLAADGSPRLRGVLGRVGQAVKVRGMFLHPQQIASALAPVPGLAAYRFYVSRADHLDHLRADVVTAPGTDAVAVTTEVREKVLSGLRFTCRVVAVDSLVEGEALVDEREWT